MATTKKCSKCNEQSPIENFYRTTASSRDGRVNQCKKCKNDYQRKRYHNTPKKRKITKTHWKYGCSSKNKKEYQRRVGLHKSYGITLERYNEMSAIQGHKCFICGEDASKSNRALSVDHDHSTGEIRALLCNPCNVGLGYFKDNYEIMQQASNYLKGFKK